ncbi:epoxide hydrolase N-terminal domain-containing protein [Streptomyces sp. NPDC005373]|uniref:epoxide hydrolase N-terminal domain-containing protein n=1 Tax=Streptomyces sp. NPDC005373 TaxID=3156879 RepID=UPI0033B75336
MAAVWPGPGLATRELRELVDCWAEKSAWRTVECGLNRLSRFQADVGAESGAFRFPFLPSLGNGPSPRPLVFGHGRPGVLWGDPNDPRPDRRPRRPSSPGVAVGSPLLLRRRPITERTRVWRPSASTSSAGVPHPGPRRVRTPAALG